MEKKRITITCYDEEGFELATQTPLCHFIETTKETGHCLCRCFEDRMVYIEKTKVGFTIKAWKEVK